MAGSERAMDVAKDEVKRLTFMRITVLGATSCGKSSLIHAYVNNHFPERYTRTEKAIIYHKKLELVDEGEWEDVKKPTLLEVEDSPGSEKGNEGDDDDSRDAAAPDVIRKGSRVVLMQPSEKEHFQKMFNDPKYKDKCKYKPAMLGMLGKTYPVKEIAKDGSYGLPSPDGSEGGIWNFPPKTVKPKLSLELPIDQFLQLGEKEMKKPTNVSERAKLREDFQRPFRAYHRIVGAPDVDKSLTKNRMGYLICFDVSEDDGSSLKEAMMVHSMLTKSLANAKNVALKPIVWFVGCKGDRTAQFKHIKKNRDSAQAYSDDKEIPLVITSARDNKNVSLVFEEMIQAIGSRENLWSLEGVDEEEDEENKECRSARRRGRRRGRAPSARSPTTSSPTASPWGAPRRPSTSCSPWPRRRAPCRPRSSRRPAPSTPP